MHGYKHTHGKKRKFIFSPLPSLCYSFPWEIDWRKGTERARESMFTVVHTTGLNNRRREGKVSGREGGGRRELPHILSQAISPLSLTLLLSLSGTTVSFSHNSRLPPSNTITNTHTSLTTTKFLREKTFSPLLFVFTLAHCLRDNNKMIFSRCSLYVKHIKGIACTHTHRHTHTHPYHKHVKSNC